LEGAVVAVKIFDHPLRFLTYEGPVQKDMGRVRIVDHGNCEVSDQAGDVITLTLRGMVLQGGFTLTRIEGTFWQLAPGP
jgi:hypothetical protein